MGCRTNWPMPSSPMWTTPTFRRPGRHAAKNKERIEMADDVAAAIQKASAGLEYPSESDAPFDLVRWDAANGDPTPETVSKFAGRAKEKTKQLPVDEFFAALAETDDAAGFEKLEAVLKKNLTDLRVYRVG